LESIESSKQRRWDRLHRQHPRAGHRPARRARGQLGTGTDTRSPIRIRPDAFVSFHGRTTPLVCDGRPDPATQVLVRMRLGGVSNRSLRTVARKSWEDYRALRANGVGGLGALVWKNLSKLPQFVRR